MDESTAPAPSPIPVVVELRDPAPEALDALLDALLTSRGHDLQVAS